MTPNFSKLGVAGLFTLEKKVEEQEKRVEAQGNELRTLKNNVQSLLSQQQTVNVTNVLGDLLDQAGLTVSPKTDHLVAEFEAKEAEGEDPT